jgi:hypothetical protein
MNKNAVAGLLSFIVAVGAGGAIAAAPVNQRASVLGSSIAGPRLHSIPANPPPVAPNVNISAPQPGPSPDPAQPLPPPDDYGANDCMKDLSDCVAGALPGGIADLYDAAARSDILSGAGFCSAPAGKCAARATVGRRPVYKSSADAWEDFNSRVILPSYHAFVTRATGLTPVQAESACLALDGGDALSAPRISQSAFMSASGSKWGSINDKMTGNARWDAAKAECVVRVSAYNKDNAITNSWLFGIAGDDRPAEVWRKAGDVFTCNRDLFGFSLMNNTKTAAVVGIGGAAAVGAGAGAVIGHNQGREFSCDDEGDRKKLADELVSKGLSRALSGGASGAAPQSEAMTPDACRALLAIRDDSSADEVMRGHVKSLDVLKGVPSKAGQGALIGAGVGAATGGIATLITAFVEKNNINCRIGGNPARVGYGKSGKIESLRDVYTKQSTGAPESIEPPAPVESCEAWKSACAAFNDEWRCGNAQVRRGKKDPTPVMGACVRTGGACVASAAAQSNEACE